jgi:hypothetical protein
MAWIESSSANFTARHSDSDVTSARDVLELLEQTRERLAAAFPAIPDDVTVVLHDSRTGLDFAQPVLPIMRRLTTPAARRYVAGWAGKDELHSLTPRLLRERAANVEGSPEMLLLTPAALYVQLVVATSNRALPPPWTLERTVRAARWAWLVAGTAQWFSGQTAHARPAIARRLREGPRPSFPPRLRDAALLGGTVVDLIARDAGAHAAVRFACSLPPGGPRQSLIEIFDGRDLLESEGTWRAHLGRLAAR